jgi:hypothetical protein
MITEELIGTRGEKTMKPSYVNPATQGRDDELLPGEFAELQPFVTRWARARFEERYAARLSSSMEEIQHFYDAMLPMMEKIAGYLNRLDRNSMPEDARRLFFLGLAFFDIMPVIELYRQQEVPYGFEAARVEIIDPPCADQGR